jgi:adenylate cyclase
MADTRPERRLTAILAGDVAGYSRLMGADEEGTLNRLKAHRHELVDRKIAEHRGRIVKSTGDGILVEFASVVDAVRCAREMQDGMRERNAGVPGGQRIEFRIGINVGDIISDGNDIFGDGVNVAARLEGIAEPGGICVSAKVRDEIADKLDIAFDDWGERELKNIARPIRVYAVRAAGTASSAPEQVGLMRQGPSIAVLPFTNMSGDPEQEYFADGVVEDIITALARYPRLFVVARNSSFGYKGKAVDIRQVGRDLGVRYVLEGSIRKAANRVRITGQLIEAESGRHVWAERYDGELADIFDLQDRITGHVVGTIEPHIQAAEIERSLKKRPDDLTAYDLFLQAKRNFHLVTGHGLDEAIALAERALSLDPNFAAAAVLVSRARGYRVASGRRQEIDEDIDLALQLAKKALQLDPIDVDVLANGGRMLAWTGTDYEGGLELAGKSTSIYPYSAYAWGEAGWVNMHCARPAEALRCLERAIELSPRDPFEFDRLAVKSWAHIQLGEFDHAIAVARQSLQINRNLSAGHRAFTASLALAGRIADAQQAGRELLAIEPNFTVSRYNRRTRWVAESKTNLLKGLRLAGLPE